MTVAEFSLRQKRQQQAEQIYQLLLANVDGLTMRAIATALPDIPKEAVPKRLALLIRMNQIDMRLRTNQPILYTAVEEATDAD